MSYYKKHTDRITIASAAVLLGISPKSVTRWQDEERLPRILTRSAIEARRAELTKRPRGPRRNPQSKRYTVGRHRFAKGVR